VQGHWFLDEILASDQVEEANTYVISETAICDGLVSEGNIVLLLLLIRRSYPVLKSCERVSERLNPRMVIRKLVPCIICRPAFDQLLESCVAILQTGLDCPD
jgi:hypothetical protein